MSSPNRFNFTKKSIQSLPSAPRGKRAYYYDTKASGLAVAVTPKGTKTFILYKRIDGVPERVTIGRFPDFTIEQARNEALQLNALIAKGQNPQDLKRKSRAEYTLGEFFDEYMTRHARPHKKSWQADQRQFDRHLEKWRKKRLSAIKKADIQKLHVKTGDKTGHYTANRLLALIHTVFAKAIDWGFYEKSNPAAGIKKFKEKSRERFLQADELPRFFQAVADEPNETIRDFILICLLTGARRGNVQAMRWEHLNLEVATWTIPETKSGEPHTVPLVPSALHLLRNRHASAEGPFVFPGKGRTQHLVEVKTAWKRILIRANIDDLHIHDLRRTLGSWQAATGASLAVIGKSLAHKNINTTLIYARLNIDPVRDAMERATGAIWDAGGLTEEGDVVDFRKAKGK